VGVGLSSFEIFSSVSKVLCPTMCFVLGWLLRFSFLYISFAYVFVPKHMLISLTIKDYAEYPSSFLGKIFTMRSPNTLRKFSKCFMKFILHDFPSPLLSLLASRHMNLVLSIL
jgi:hypothetical protein